MSTTFGDYGFLPLSSLRLIVPPLQLVSAALWEIVKQGTVVHYGLLEEFISSVLETVPELLTDTERVQLVMGLRAKVVLDLVCNRDFTSQQAIQPHLNRINTYIKDQDREETSSSEVKASLTNFLRLVNTLMDDQCQKDIFYQKIFPAVFGTEYDAALQALMRKFLLNLQKLLPVPNLEQTSMWLSQFPSILKECADFMNQPEPLNTLIQHHKHHGHKVQASPSYADDCILSSLSYHLPNVHNDQENTLIKYGSMCVSQDWQMDNSLASESENIKKENVMEIKSELMCNIEINGQQHANDLAEDQGASIEVILQPFDESESYNHVKTGSRKSSKTVKCLVCGKDFGSLKKLKMHKMTRHDGLTNKRSQSNSAIHKIHVRLKPKTCIDNNASRSEAELPPLASATTHSPKSLNRLLKFEQSDDNCDLVCHLCGKVYTYQKNFDKHKKACLVSSEQQAETDQQCATSLAHHSKLNPADRTKESPPSETDTGPSDVVPQESLESPQQQTSKRSDRVKQCSVCRKVFSCSADLMSHMRCHIEQNDYDKFKDKCRISQQHSQDNPLSNAKKSKWENPVVSSGTSQVPTITDGPANSQAVQPCKSPLKCQDCEQLFIYHKNLEKHQSECSKGASQGKMQTKYFIINGCHFQSGDKTNRTCDETTSGTAKTPISADLAEVSKVESFTMKCTMCQKNLSKIPPINEHYSMSYDGSDLYPCSLCKRSFVRLSELVRHQQNQKLYQCATCMKCFSTTGRKTHDVKLNACQMPSVCAPCRESFKCLANQTLDQGEHGESMEKSSLTIVPTVGKTSVQKTA